SHEVLGGLLALDLDPLTLTVPVHRDEPRATSPGPCACCTWRSSPGPLAGEDQAQPRGQEILKVLVAFDGRDLARLHELPRQVYRDLDPLRLDLRHGPLLSRLRMDHTYVYTGSVSRPSLRRVRTSATRPCVRYCCMYWSNSLRFTTSFRSSR